MDKKAIIPYIFLVGLYALIACFVHACYTLWYSNIPERVVFLQSYLDSIGELTCIVTCVLGMLLALLGGIVLYKLKFIDKTWLVVYCVAPPILGFILSQVIYLISF
jgi:hypothetical protein